MSKENNLALIQVPKVLYENRYCNQEGFSILICGGKDKKENITNEVLELKTPSFKVNKFLSMVQPHCYSDLVVIKSDVLAVGKSTELIESLNKSVVTVEIYSGKTKTWTNHIIDTEEKFCYCIGSFMSNLYLVGGCIIGYKSLSTCYTYDTNTNTWNEIADLNVARYYAACTVFEGKIVVTGGENNWSSLKSVEAYDYYENKWTFLPEMVEERYFHATVSMGNKMYIIAGD